MNIDWTAVLTSEASVVGLLVAVLLMVAFGILVPRWYMKALERKYDHEKARGDDQAESLRVLADWAKKQTDIGETVTHTMKSLQKRDKGEDK